MPFIGQPLPRFEDLRLVRGAGHYTDDFAYPNQAYAAFVRSPHAHARIRAITTQAAVRAQGVIAVLTGAEYFGDGGKDVVVDLDEVRGIPRGRGALRNDHRDRLAYVAHDLGG